MKSVLHFIKKLSVWQQLLICLAAVSLFFSVLFGYTLRQFEREFLLRKRRLNRLIVDFDY